MRDPSARRATPSVANKNEEQSVEPQGYLSSEGTAVNNEVQPDKDIQQAIRWHIARQCTDPGWRNFFIRQRCHASAEAICQKVGGSRNRLCTQPRARKQTDRGRACLLCFSLFTRKAPAERCPLGASAECRAGRYHGQRLGSRSEAAVRLHQ